MENAALNIGNSLVVNKFYMVWQDEDEENWLREMSLQGWHLTGVSCGFKYYFIKGDPKNYYYRLDYINPFKADKGEYINFFRDMGWTYIGDVFNGWQYFRTENEVEKGKIAEIYTDRNSKIEKNLRIQRILLAVLFLNLVVGTSNFLKGLERFHGINNTMSLFSLLNLACVGLLLYAMVKIWRRVHRLKSRI
ncbi:MAG: DUF2812 domain-containing protein [Clostridia bacterium]|nr:DUF2812 domain-containing protein [Clostridia bacterium]